MSPLRAADHRSLWLRVPLIICTALLFNGERDTGAGAHSANRVVGIEFNSSGLWTYKDQYVFDQELIVYFDFNQKKFIAAKDWAQRGVDRWNKEFAETTYQEAIVFCQSSIPIIEREVLPRRVEPKVTVQSKTSQHSGQSALLTCHVTGFYPPEIEVTWLKNGAIIPNGTINTALLSDGDWTYQVEEFLQYQPVSGDKYTCRVEHISLKKARSMDWDPPFIHWAGPSDPRGACELHAPLGYVGLHISKQSVPGAQVSVDPKAEEVQSTRESERTKIVIGSLGFVFGLIILLAGVIMRLKNAKAILDSSNHGPRLMGPALG